jgi:branched-subunit amino acid transport protein
MSMWVVVIVAGIATFAMRFVFIALFGVVTVPPLLERALRYVAPAVLAALAIPAIAAPDATLDLFNPFVPAAIAGAVAAWYTKSIGAAILVGLPALWLVLWVT